MRQHRRVLARVVACKGGVASQMYRFLADELHPRPKSQEQSCCPRLSLPRLLSFCCRAAWAADRKRARLLPLQGFIMAGSLHNSDF